MEPSIFGNRIEAGRLLAEHLQKYASTDAVVLGLPRGGVVPAYEIARQFKLPLGVLLVRKIGHPLDPEYAIGAIAEGAEAVYKEGQLDEATDRYRQKAESEAQALINKRRQAYYASLTEPEIKDKTAIIVDDGIATGFTMSVAVEAAKRKGAKKIVLAIPVAPSDSLENLRTSVDEVILLADASQFLGSVGAHYREFNQVTDDEVIELLTRAGKSLG